MESLTLLRLLAVYVLLTSLERLTGSGALRALVNAFGVLMPFLMVAYFAWRGRQLELPRGLTHAYALLVASLAMSVLVAGLYDAADLAKILLAPLFAFLGYNALAFDRHDPVQVRNLRWVSLVLVLPLLYAALLNRNAVDGDALGIFANRNNAALYLVVLGNVLFLMGAQVGTVMVTLVVGALMFSTLGVVIAVLIGLLASLSVRRYLPAYLAAVVMGFIFVVEPFPLPIAERLTRLAEGVAAITSQGLWTELANLSYADLYVITGQNSDLSLFFRIKHWEDLLLVWSSGGWATWLFGLGIGSAPFHTDIGLVPHNDYVRFLIEAGPFALIGFVWMTGWLLMAIGRKALLMSTAAVAIYFFTENLVGNFAAMTLYFWFAGYWARHAGQAAPAAQALPGPGIAPSNSVASSNVRRHP